MALTSAVILLVEDDEAVLKITAAVLTRDGATVYPCVTGRDAQQMATRLSRIDLLLSDVLLPDVGGIELARVIQAWHPEMRVLLMSASARISKATPLPFLTKPFSPTALLTRVHEVLDTKE